MRSQILSITLTLTLTLALALTLTLIRGFESDHESDDGRGESQSN